MSDEKARRLLEEGRRRERAQTHFYRALAARAETEADAALSERLNELHADEQHHLSRLTARLLELGGAPARLGGAEGPEPELAAWEEVARRRERDEVAWYQEALAEELDPTTRAVLEEILESERRHEAELKGKWMSA